MANAQTADSFEERDGKAVSRRKQCHWSPSQASITWNSLTHLGVAKSRVDVLCARADFSVEQLREAVKSVIIK